MARGGGAITGQNHPFKFKNFCENAHVWDEGHWRERKRERERERERERGGGYEADKNSSKFKLKTYSCIRLE